MASARDSAHLPASKPISEKRKLGAWPTADGTDFAIWTDKAREVKIRWNDAKTRGEVCLAQSSNAHVYESFIAGLAPGTSYEVLLDGVPCVDPFARSLPHGVHGPAEVAELPRPPKKKRPIELERGEVIYELHIGTFTDEGTFAAAAHQLPKLAELGVTVLELMPIAAFAGRRGWGYDGVALMAPFAPYGTLQELTAFIDAAHGCGLSVVLDVVYNHLGPDGNYLPAFSDSYFDSERNNAWGKAPALDKAAFRRLVLDSARYWLEDVGFDGLRIDAAHELEPGGNPHILQELAAVAKACSPPAVLIAEDDRNHPGALFELGIDAVWSDDFHHSIHVLLTSERDGYYAAYQGDLAELARVIERGQLYEGQIFPVTGRPRGKPSADVPRHRLIYALQNHDQVGNRAHGERLHSLSNIAQFKTVSLLFLFLPTTPLLFMGQELGTDSPFLYFTDHAGELGHAITRGRREEFGHFQAFREGDAEALPDPQAETTYLRSKLRREVDCAAAVLEFHRLALTLRREDSVMSAPRKLSAGVEGTVLWVLAEGAAGRRLLLLNIGGSVTLHRIGSLALTGVQPVLSTAPVLRDGPGLNLPDECCAIFALPERN
ncbi:MAG TPA: alpha-amylase family glycosyl hydrolase [Polyangiaceae bacterium]|nr:alpha-amylase family glycosyl hydrolase [Polyangiaceae bacterium]